MAFRVAVLVSGEGTNLQALLDSVHGREGVDVVAVASSRAEARGLERAAAAGVETGVFAKAEHSDRDARDAALGNWLDDHSVDLIVLAGWMEILGGPFIRRFEGRIVNVHPSLLPSFRGVRPIEQALESGVKVMGVTVHFVDQGVDSGPVIAQRAFDVPADTSLGDIETRVHAIEHELLPNVVRAIAAGRVALDPGGSRVVRITPGE